MILSPDCLCFARYRGGGGFICKTKQEMNTFSIHMKRHAAGPFTVNDPASMQVVVVGRNKGQKVFNVQCQSTVHLTRNIWSDVKMRSRRCGYPHAEQKYNECHQRPHLLRLPRGRWSSCYFYSAATTTTCSHIISSSLLACCEICGTSSASRNEFEYYIIYLAEWLSANSASDKNCYIFSS